jgi:hypothetical protein
MTGNKSSRVIVTPRDRLLFAELHGAKLMDREQAQLVTAIEAINRANDRLQRLHQAGLVRRYLLGTQAGGRKALYALSPKSAAIIGVEKFWKFQRAENELLVGDAFVEHQLAVNWCWISAKYRLAPGVEFLRWLRFQSPLSTALPLIPDGYAELNHGGIHPIFFEVDLGTEPSKVWDKKIALYVKLAASGEFERIFRQTRFKVAVVVSSERRLQSLRKTVSKQTGKIFYFLDLKTIKRDGLFVSRWLRPEGDERVPLA